MQLHLCTDQTRPDLCSALSPLETSYLYSMMFNQKGRLCQNNTRLGFSEHVLRPWRRRTGRSEAQIKKDYGEEGDLGVVAASSRGKQKPMFPPPRLTVVKVLGLPRAGSGSDRVCPLTQSSARWPWL